MQKIKKILGKAKYVLIGFFYTLLLPFGCWLFETFISSNEWIPFAKAAVLFGIASLWLIGLVLISRWILNEK